MKRSSGFTLLEILLVMAVIAMISAMAYPTVTGWFRGETLKSASDSVRAAVAMARHLAIEEGEPYRLAIVEGMGNIRTAPDRDDAWPGPIDPSEEFEDALPQGIILEVEMAGIPAPVDMGSKKTSMEKGQVSGQSWVTVATFYPDGRADNDVRLVVQGLGVQPVIVQIRALTGTSSVVKE